VEDPARPVEAAGRPVEDPARPVEAAGRPVEAAALSFSAARDEHSTRQIAVGAAQTLTAKRIRIAGSQPPAPEEVRSLARGLGVLGWVRADDGGAVCLHAEGEAATLEQLVSQLRSIGASESIDETRAKVEGHEQFAIRGVRAGVFVVQEHQARAHHFDLRLEVDGVMRSWAVPKGPSMDPSLKRLAVEVEDHSLAHNEFEGRVGGGAVIIWDRGDYERGGRVPWPEALERGHAVFVLHGAKLCGGFALQRTRGGQKPQWLLIKRRDEHARPGSDVVAEHPESVHSGATMQELLGPAAD
jgi:DNA ligase D-like protein (predicted 3'-phosphoesterase)